MRETINKLLATKSILNDSLRDEKEEKKFLVSDIKFQEEARAILQKAAELTQSKLSIHLSDLVSLALKSVFEEPYKFLVRFISKRGNTECELLFVDDKGNEYQPLNSCGYGPADVASFALKVSYWALGNYRPLLLIDEPFKHLSTNYKNKTSEMVKNLSTELGLQFIIITHSEELASHADKVFTISQEKGISKIL